MSNTCERLHRLFTRCPRFSFPFDESAIPRNGIYILFETGETGHGADRIVRVGTHTGQGQLRQRLKQHFLLENKDRSIFRKNIGRALLAKSADPFAPAWELDLTTREARDRSGSLIDRQRQTEIEHAVTAYIQTHFTFAVFEVPDKTARLEIESKLISTVSLCDDCGPSSTWLGNHSPKDKIRASGLWLVNELYKTAFVEAEVADLEKRLFSGTTPEGVCDAGIGSPS